MIFSKTFRIVTLILALGTLNPIKGETGLMDVAIRAVVVGAVFKVADEICSYGYYLWNTTPEQREFERESKKMRPERMRAQLEDELFQLEIATKMLQQRHKSARDSGPQRDSLEKQPNPSRDLQESLAREKLENH